MNNKSNVINFQEYKLKKEELEKKNEYQRLINIIKKEAEKLNW